MWSLQLVPFCALALEHVCSFCVFTYSSRTFHFIVEMEAVDSAKVCKPICLKQLKELKCK